MGQFWTHRTTQPPTMARNPTSGTGTCDCISLQTDKRPTNKQQQMNDWMKDYAAKNGIVYKGACTTKSCSIAKSRWFKHKRAE
jgi:hypothetical protein